MIIWIQLLCVGYGLFLGLEEWRSLRSFRAYSKLSVICLFDE
jgi:hypothetical protein